MSSYKSNNQKPDFFALFDLNQNFLLDLNLLEEKYLKLQKDFHPDLFSTSLEKNLALRQILLINEGYEILKNPVTRADYLLELSDHESLKSDTSLAGIESRKRPNEVDILILQEVMSIRMEIEEIEELSSLQNLQKKHLAYQTEIMNNFATSFSAKNYNLAAKFLLKLRYLTKILIEIDDKIWVKNEII